MSKHYRHENRLIEDFPYASKNSPIDYSGIIDNKQLLPDEAIFINVERRMIHPKKYPTEGQYMSELDAKRKLVALKVPQVVPPITIEELRGLTKPTEAEAQLRELDEMAGYQSTPAKFVAVVEADTSFDVSINDEWGFNSDIERDTVVTVGTTALFNVATYSMQANVLQNRLDELASGRLPKEQ